MSRIVKINYQFCYILHVKNTQKSDEITHILTYIYILYKDIHVIFRHIFNQIYYIHYVKKYEKNVQITHILTYIVYIYKDIHVIFGAFFLSFPLVLLGEYNK